MFFNSICEFGVINAATAKAALEGSLATFKSLKKSHKAHYSILVSPFLYLKF